MLNQQQIENRATGIGASECAALFGESPWLTAYKLFMIKTGQIQPDDLSKSEPVIWGNILEDGVAVRYGQVTGLKLRRSNITFRHKQHPHIFCHPDRIIEGEKKLVEVKCTASWNKGYGDEESDNIPSYVLIQVQHQMLVKNVDVTDVAVFKGIHFPLSIYTIQRDFEMSEIITEKCNKFWIDNVLKKVAPPLVNKQDVLLGYPLNNGRYKEVDDDIVKVFEKYKDLKTTEKQLKIDFENVVDTMCLEILDADGIAYKNKPLLSWKADKRGIRSLRILK